MAGGFFSDGMGEIVQTLTIMSILARSEAASWPCWVAMPKILVPWQCHGSLWSLCTNRMEFQQFSTIASGMV